MNAESSSLEQKVDILERDVAALKSGRRGRRPKRTVRKRSSRMLMGLPLYDVAIGPDPVSGECCGRARGFFAVGDVAIGVFALGGIAIGLFALGGISLGIVLALGGLAIGSVALGGAAVGVVALGGAVVGYAAWGGAAVGYHAHGGAVYSPH